jgi:hypothetical protein
LFPDISDFTQDTVRSLVRLEQTVVKTRNRGGEGDREISESSPIKQRQIECVWRNPIHFDVRKRQIEWG